MFRLMHLSVSVALQVAKNALGGMVLVSGFITSTGTSTTAGTRTAGATSTRTSTTGTSTARTFTRSLTTTTGSRKSIVAASVRQSVRRRVYVSYVCACVTGVTVTVDGEVMSVCVRGEAGYLKFHLDWFLTHEVLSHVDVSRQPDRTRTEMTDTVHVINVNGVCSR